MEDLTYQDVLLFYEDGVTILKPSMTKVDRNRILNDVFVEGKLRGNKPCIIPEGDSRTKSSPDL